jgi:uncharacterized protein YcfJ
MMKLQRIAVLLALPCLALTQVAQANHDDDADGSGFYDFAKVVHVEPMMSHVRVSDPRRECAQEQVPVYEGDSGYRSGTPTILGGIIGGVVGNTMGYGRGKTVATVAGTVLGGSIGRDIGYQNNPPRSGYTRYATQENCRMVDDYREEERVDGYRVTYRYNGGEYVTRTDHDPGNKIRVHVDVQPAE